MRRYLETAYPCCGVEGCDETFGLQIDHVVDYGDVHETAQDNTWRICKHHHDLKTYFGWTVTGTTGHWNLVPPDDWTDDPHPCEPCPLRRNTRRVVTPPTQTVDHGDL